MANYGNGVITLIKFHATVRLGEADHDLGDFDSEKDAQNAIDAAEAEWERDFEDTGLILRQSNAMTARDQVLRFPRK